MGEYAYSTIGDATLPEDIIRYKPICRGAALSLLAGLAAVIAALMVADIGPWWFVSVPAIGILLGIRGLGAVRRYDMAGRGAAKAGIALSGIALVCGLSAFAYVTAYSVPPDYMQISYDPLQPKGIDPMIADEAKELAGKKIYLKGYMYPTDELRGLKSFTLCRDNGTCCFGGQPKLSDMVQVTLKDGKTMDYTSSLRGIGGVFRTEAKKGPGSLGTIVYHIDDADIVH